jgi:transposase
VSHLDLSSFEQAYSAEGGELYAPELMLSVWLYAYAVGITSARLLEKRLVEDLPLRYLGGGARVDNWALSAFRRRHARGLNDAFTQVLEMARGLGLGRLGRVAIDSTRIKANASRDRMETEQRLRHERAKLRRQVRRWQKACDGEDPEPAGAEVKLADAERKLAALPRRLEKLRKSGMKRLSRTDEDARFLRERGGRFALGYTAEVAVSDDHLIVWQRVSQSETDNASLLPLVEEVEQQLGMRPQQVLADSGFFSLANVEELERRGIEVYVPDSNLARELNTGQRACSVGRNRIRSPQLRRLRRKLRSPDGRQVYARRKAVVEPVFGVLKQQRGMRQFRLRGLPKVKVEFTLAALAYNLNRLYVTR